MSHLIHDITTNGGDGSLASTDTTTGRSMHELAVGFTESLCAGDRSALADVLGSGVVYQAPGRSVVAGVHRGRDRVVDKLNVAAAPGVAIDGAVVTELMTDGDRAFAAILMTGRTPSRPFRFEVAFHLQSDGDEIVGITEYSGDQHTADELVAGASDVAVTTGPGEAQWSPPDPETRRPRRWLRRRP